MTIRAIIFDIGGVLELTPDTQLVERWALRLGKESGQLSREIDRAWGSGRLFDHPEAELRQKLLEITDMDQMQADAFTEDFWHGYLGELNSVLAAYFHALRPRYQTAILSNSFAGARKREQERYQFHEMTDLIIYSHEEGLEKPDRRFFELACTRLDVAPAEVIFLDDVEKHVLAARALGMQAVQFKENEQAMAAINAYLSI